MISIIICTCNRAESLRETLRALAQIEVPQGLQCELLLVDNGSTDATPQLIAHALSHALLPLLPIRTVVAAERGLSRARNAGIRAARGEILLFTDDDIRPAPGWISAMSTPIMDKRAQAVAGGVVFAPNLERAWMRPLHRRLLAETAHLGQAPKTMVGANMAFARAVLDKVPSFDEELGAGALGVGEETLFSMQLGEAGFVIAPAFEVAVEHHFEASRLGREALLDRARKEGRAEAYLAYHWWHHDPRSVALGLQKHRLELGVWRARHRSATRRTEGCEPQEMELEKDVAFYQQFAHEQRRKRAYPKRGLLKLT